MAEPQRLGEEDPQAKIETQRIELPGQAARTLTDKVQVRVENVVQRTDVEHAEVGDVFVSGSGTTREVLEKIGPTNFRFKVKREYEGSTAVDWRFRLEPQGDNMRLGEIGKLPIGTLLYGPEEGNPPMVLEEIKTLGDGIVYAIVASYEEHYNVDLDRMGEWLVAINKKKDEATSV